MFTAPIPGGECTVRTAGEMTVRHRRALALKLHLFGRARFVQIVGLAMDAGSLQEEDLGVSPAETTALEDISDTVSWALLDGWTIPGPTPQSPADVHGLPPDLRAALADAVSGEGSRAIREVLGIGEGQHRGA